MQGTAFRSHRNSEQLLGIRAIKKREGQTRGSLRTATPQSNFSPRPSSPNRPPRLGTGAAAACGRPRGILLSPGSVRAKPRPAVLRAPATLGTTGALFEKCKVQSQKDSSSEAWREEGLTAEAGAATTGSPPPGTRSRGRRTEISKELNPESRLF